MLASCAFHFTGPLRSVHNTLTDAMAYKLSLRYIILKANLQDFPQTRRCAYQSLCIVMGHSKAPIVQPGTVAQRVQNLNGTHKTHLQRHKSLPRLPSEATSQDYRKHLKHIDPHPSQPQSPNFPWPKLRHYHRPSYQHSETYLLPNSSHDEPHAPIAVPKPRAPLRAGLDKYDDEIRTRTRQRPFLQHICGHFDQAATVTVPHDSSNQHLVEKGTEGSFIVVGPSLQSSIVGERLQKVMNNGDPFIIPFPCVACQKSISGSSHRRSSAPAVPGHAVIEEQAIGEKDEHDSKSNTTSTDRVLNGSSTPFRTPLSSGSSRPYSAPSSSRLLATFVSSERKGRSPTA
jgi:hypothetical protein